MDLEFTAEERAFRAEVAESARLGQALALRACPRVHFKAVIVDGAFVYVGSANWTGAGLGAKSERIVANCAHHFARLPQRFKNNF